MKAFIIHLPKSEKSKEVVSRSLDSMKNISDIDITLFEGIDRYQAWSEFINSDFKIREVTRWGIGYINSELGTFYSHYNLWKKCKELNESIIIFEHDAILKNSFNINNLIDFDGDVLNLGNPSWGTDDCRPHPTTWTNHSNGIHFRNVCKNNHDKNKVNEEICYCDTMWLFGAHAYMITPTGADKLIKSTELGILPADIYIRQEIVDIWDYLPHPFSQDEKFSLIQRHTMYDNQEIGQWDY